MTFHSPGCSVAEPWVIDQLSDFPVLPPPPATRKQEFPCGWGWGAGRVLVCGRRVYPGLTPWAMAYAFRPTLKLRALERCRIDFPVYVLPRADVPGSRVCGDRGYPGLTPWAMAYAFRPTLTLRAPSLLHSITPSPFPARTQSLTRSSYTSILQSTNLLRNQEW